MYNKLCVFSKKLPQSQLRKSTVQFIIIQLKLLAQLLKSIIDCENIPRMCSWEKSLFIYIFTNFKIWFC